MTSSPSSFWTPRVAHAPDAQGGTRPELLAVLAWTQEPDERRDDAWIARGTELLGQIADDELLLLLRLAPGGLGGLGWLRQRLGGTFLYGASSALTSDPRRRAELASLTVARLAPFYRALVDRLASSQRQSPALLSPILEELVNAPWLEWSSHIENNKAGGVTEIQTPITLGTPEMARERHQAVLWQDVLTLLAPAAEWLATTPITPGSEAEQEVLAWISSPKRSSLVVEMLAPQISSLTPAIIQALRTTWPKVSTQILTRRLPWAPAVQSAPDGPVELLPLVRWLSTLRGPRPLNVARARGLLLAPSTEPATGSKLVQPIVSLPETVDTEDLRIHDGRTLRPQAELLQILRAHVLAPPQTKGGPQIPNGGINYAAWPGWFALQRTAGGTDPVLADVLLQLEAQGALRDPTVDAQLSELFHTVPLPADPLDPSRAETTTALVRTGDGQERAPNLSQITAVRESVLDALTPLLQRTPLTPDAPNPLGPQTKRFLTTLLRLTPDLLQRQKPDTLVARLVRDAEVPEAERNALLSAAITQIGHRTIRADRAAESIVPLSPTLLQTWQAALPAYTRRMTDVGMLGDGKDHHEVAVAILSDPRTPLDLLHRLASDARWSDPMLRCAIAKHPLAPTDPVLRPILRRLREPAVLLELLESADAAELAVLTARILESGRGKKLWLERVEATPALQARLDRRLLRPLLLDENNERRTRAIALAGTLSAPLADAPLPARARVRRPS